MTYPPIKYQTGFLHQVCEDYMVQTPVRPSEAIVSKWVDLNTAGIMTIRNGFGSDGTSFYTTRFKKLFWNLFKKKLKGSIVHDAFYYLFKKGLLTLAYRPTVDDFAKELWLDSGVPNWIASLDRWGLTKGGIAALPENDRPVLEAK